MLDRYGPVAAVRGAGLFAGETPEDDMATLRARIGETAFEQARAQGAAMGRKDAVEHALAESARAPTRGRETVS